MAINFHDWFAGRYPKIADALIKRTATMDEKWTYNVVKEAFYAGEAHGKDSSSPPEVHAGDKPRGTDDDFNAGDQNVACILNGCMVQFADREERYVSDAYMVGSAFIFRFNRNMYESPNERDADAVVDRDGEHYVWDRTDDLNVLVVDVRNVRGLSERLGEAVIRYYRERDIERIALDPGKNDLLD